jgi:hypothetical protein
MEEASMRGLAGPEPAFPDVGGGIALGRKAETIILLLAQVFPAGAPRFNKVLGELKEAIAEGISASGQIPGSSPEDVGAQFPGGGFTSGIATGPK